MKITRVQIAARGLANRCPNCGGRTLFKAGTFFEVNKACPVCGLKIERDEGFFLGSMSLNYGVTLVVVDHFSGGGETGEVTLTYAKPTEEAPDGTTYIKIDADGDGQTDMTIAADGDHRDFTNFVL